MKKILEGLWDEYALEKCSAIDTVEEENLAKRALDLHEAVNEMLDETQKDAVEKYLDAVCDINACFAKKAFFKGCEFASSFLTELGRFEK